MSPSNQYGKQLLTWEVPEFEAHERSRGWYIIGIIIAVALLLYAIFSANFLFAVIILISTVVMYLKIITQPRQIVFAIYETGIRVGQHFYDWKELQDFYIIYEPPAVKSLFIHCLSWTQPRISIPLLQQNPLTVRQILLEYLAEDLDQEEEPFSHAIERLFKL